MDMHSQCQVCMQQIASCYSCSLLILFLLCSHPCPDNWWYTEMLFWWQGIWTGLGGHQHGLFLSFSLVSETVSIITVHSVTDQVSHFPWWYPEYDVSELCMSRSSIHICCSYWCHSLINNLLQPQSFYRSYFINVWRGCQFPVALFEILVLFLNLHRNLLADSWECVAVQLLR